MNLFIFFTPYSHEKEKRWKESSKCYHEIMKHDPDHKEAKERHHQIHQILSSKVNILHVSLASRDFILIDRKKFPFVSLIFFSARSAPLVILYAEQRILVRSPPSPFLFFIILAENQGN